jgi:tripartite-type tricarboxylate transporter receptor subunit TctC
MRLIRLLIPAFLVFSTQHAIAQANYPDRPIKMIVPRARLNAEVLKAVGDADVRRKLEELGFAVRGSSAEELRVMTRDQLAKYERVIKEMGIAKE